MFSATGGRYSRFCSPFQRPSASIHKIPIFAFLYEIICILIHNICRTPHRHAQTLGTFSSSRFFEFQCSCYTHSTRSLSNLNGYVICINTQKNNRKFLRLFFNCRIFLYCTKLILKHKAFVQLPSYHRVQLLI